MSNAPNDQDYPVTSANHAFHAGLVVGLVMKAGYTPDPDVDDKGDYLASLTVIVPHSIRPIRIVVLDPDKEDDGI